VLLMFITDKYCNRLLFNNKNNYTKFFTIIFMDIKNIHVIKLAT